MLEIESTENRKISVIRGGFNIGCFSDLFLSPVGFLIREQHVDCLQEEKVTWQLLALPAQSPSTPAGCISVRASGGRWGVEGLLPRSL